MVANLVNSALPFELINSRLHMEFGEKNGQLVLELLFDNITKIYGPVVGSNTPHGIF